MQANNSGRPSPQFEPSAQSQPANSNPGPEFFARPTPEQPTTIDIVEVQGAPPSQLDPANPAAGPQQVADATVPTEQQPTAQASPPLRPASPPPGIERPRESFEPGSPALAQFVEPERAAPPPVRPAPPVAGPDVAPAEPVFGGAPIAVPLAAPALPPAGARLFAQPPGQVADIQPAAPARNPVPGLVAPANLAPAIVVNEAVPERFHTVGIVAPPAGPAATREVVSAPVTAPLAGRLVAIGSPLGEIVPFDIAALERGMEQFLNQFERLAVAVTVPVGRYTLPAWLVSAGAAVLAWEVGRRQLRQRDHDDLFAPALGDPASPWPAGWSGPAPEDRA
jgi:hypothetical protein